MKAVVLSLLVLTAAFVIVPEASAGHCSQYPYWSEMTCRAWEAVCALTCYVIGDIKIEGAELLA